MAYIGAGAYSILFLFDSIQIPTYSAFALKTFVVPVTIEAFKMP